MLSEVKKLRIPQYVVGRLGWSHVTVHSDWGFESHQKSLMVSFFYEQELTKNVIQFPFHNNSKDIKDLDTSIVIFAIDIMLQIQCYRYNVIVSYMS